MRPSRKSHVNISRMTMRAVEGLAEPSVKAVLRTRGKVRRQLILSGWAIAKSGGLQALNHVLMFAVLIILSFLVVDYSPRIYTIHALEAVGSQLRPLVDHARVQNSVSYVKVVAIVYR